MNTLEAFKNLVYPEILAKILFILECSMYSTINISTPSLIQVSHFPAAFQKVSTKNASIPINLI